MLRDNRLRLLTLGRLTLVGSSGEEHESLAKRRRKLALLAVLAMARRPIARDTLVEMFWGAEDEAGLCGLLVLEQRPAELHIWSVSVAPRAQGRGVGNHLLAAAEARARELGIDHLTLLTGERLTHNIDWYARHGYQVIGVEALADRTIVHMQKVIEIATGETRVREIEG